jgi:hypothetical protein
MRRIITIALVAAVLACNSDSAGPPVQTVNGQWNGVQNGYSLGLNMVQSGTGVTGSISIAGVAGAASGTVSGSFNYPTLHLVADVSSSGYAPFTYDGTMSQAEAKIFGKLNGSGFDSVEVDVSQK